jgi:hypothetical protein
LVAALGDSTNIDVVRRLCEAAVFESYRHELGEMRQIDDKVVCFGLDAA